MTFDPFFMNDYLKIIAAMLIWSTWGPMIRWLALPPVIVLFYTSLIASFSVPAYLAVRGEMSLEGVSKVRWVLGLLALSSITNNLTYFYALGHTTVANAVFTHYTAPLFVALFAPFVISERLLKVTILSLPIALLGMIMIVVANGGLSTDGPHRSGIIAGTASGLAYAFIILFSRKLSRMLMHHKAVVVLPWLTTVVLAPAAFLIEYHLNLRILALLTITGLLHSTLAPLLYYNALRKVMAQRAAILGYMEPLSAIPMAYLLLSEKPALTALAGGVLILFSGYLVVQSKNIENEH